MDGDASLVAPTFGFKIQTIRWHDYQLHCWDIGGQRSIRPYWRNYFEETDGLVYVIDSAAPHRFAEATRELEGLLSQDKLANASVLILANKQDIDGSVRGEEIESMLGLDHALGSKSGKTHWRLFESSATKNTSQQIKEPLEWLVNDIASRLYLINNQ